MKHIVVGVDGSQSAVRALQEAIDLAALLPATVEVVSVWQPYYGTVEIPGPLEQLEERARTALADTLAAVDAGAVVLTEHVLDGDPAKVLLDRSRDADMLVVGTRGRGGFTGLLLGSVSQKCAQHATCPVLIVRDGDPA